MKITRGIIRSAIFIAALTTLPAHAKPGAITQGLMEKPASMFDLGMLRMRHQLTTWAEYWADQYWEQHTGFKSGVNINASYQADDDKIYVTLSVMESRGTEEQLALGCDKALYSTHVTIGKGVPQFFMGRNQLEDPDEFKRLRKGLMELIEISCIVYGTGSDDVRYRKVSNLNP